MKKILSLLLILALATGIMVGCSNEKNTNSVPKTDVDNKTNETNETGNENVAKEIILTHAKGEIKLDDVAKKVVVFDMGILDTIDVIAPELELAVPTSNIPSSLSKYEKATSAGTLFEPDMEAIFNFEPDLIIIGGRQADYYNELSKIAPTIYVELNAVTYMEDFKLNTTNVAKALGKEDEAKSYIDGIDKEIESIKALAKKSDKNALIIMTNDGKISAYGKGSRFGLIHDVLEITTADDTIEVSNHGQEASYEYIAQVNPDVLFVVDRTVIAGGTAKASDTLNNDLVNGINANKNDKIVYLDAEAWYLASGGINTLNLMLSEVKSALE
ncbi:MAG TPA: ABC transporter [Clostridiales bacterium]|nr:ABC transporter [Clostridiales bacterium]